MRAAAVAARSLAKRQGQQQHQRVMRNIAGSSLSYPVASAQPLGVRIRTFQSSSLRRDGSNAKEGQNGPSQSSSSSSSTSGSKQQENKKEEQESKRSKPEEDNTVHGRSPIQAFMDVFKDEIQKNRDMQDNLRQLGGEVSKVQDSEAMKKMKQAYEFARLKASIADNPRLQAAAEGLRKAGVNVNDAVAGALKQMEENSLVRGITRASAAVGSAAMSASEPIRRTEAYKAVAAEITEAWDEAANNVQFGGYLEREARQRRRLARLAKASRGSTGLAARKTRTQENPEAGSAVTLHATANTPKTSRFTSITPKPVQDLLSSFSNAYQESENPVVSTVRSVTSSIGRFFDETETAKVTKWVRELDPNFTQESFIRDLREYIVPELVDAYVNADQPTLKAWCSEATLNLLVATLQPCISPTLVSESRVMDIRGVDIMSVKILENDLHVFVVGWRTQEVLSYRDMKTGEITVGEEDKILNVGYVAVFTRVDEKLDDPVTGGWKIIDMARRAG